MDNDLSAIIAAAQAVKGYAAYRRVRLPWWKAILKRRRYEWRLITPMTRLVERGRLDAGGETWDEVKIVRLS